MSQIETQPKRDTLAVISPASAILAVVLLIAPAANPTVIASVSLALTAIVTGVVSLIQIRRHHGHGTDMAVAGIVIGLLLLAFLVLLTIALASAFSNFSLGRPTP